MQVLTQLGNVYGHKRVVQGLVLLAQANYKVL